MSDKKGFVGKARLREIFEYIKEKFRGIEKDVESLNGHFEVLAYNKNYGGENIWDEVWEFGQYDSVGIKVSSSTNIRGSNFIKVKPNTKYINVGIGLNINQYDSNQNFISKATYIENYVFVTDSTTEYITFHIPASYGLVYKNDIAIYEYEEGKTYTYKPYIMSNNQLTSAVDTIGTTTNLLNPTLQSQVLNGVSCLNNGDGTYTFNGVASNTTWFKFVVNVKSKTKYKAIGCPPNGSANGYKLLPYNINDIDILGYDYGNGCEFIAPDDIIFVYIGFVNGITINNLVFKPMITTNLQAQYSDFVPFTGSTGHLNSDVAKMKSELINLIKTKTITVTTDNYGRVLSSSSGITIKEDGILIFSTCIISPNGRACICTPYIGGDNNSVGFVITNNESSSRVVSTPVDITIYTIKL